MNTKEMLLTASAIQSGMEDQGGHEREAQDIPQQNAHSSHATLISIIADQKAEIKKLQAEIVEQDNDLSEVKDRLIKVTCEREDCKADLLRMAGQLETAQLQLKIYEGVIKLK